MESTPTFPGPKSSFAERLKWLRNFGRFSVSALAGVLECDRTYIYKLEKGNATNPSTDFLEAICGELATSRLWLETGEGRPFDTPEQDVAQATRLLTGKSKTGFAITQGLVSLQRLDDRQLNQLAHYLMFDDAGKRPEFVEDVFTEVITLAALELRRRGKLPRSLFIQTTAGTAKEKKK